MYFHSSENTRFEIFTREKPQDWNSFFSYSLREAAHYGISDSFLRETTIGVSYFNGNVNKTSESVRSLIKERAFINLSAATRKPKQ